MPYPQPPGPRIAYDLDGTVSLVRNGQTSETYDVHPDALRAMNGERGSGAAVYSTLEWSGSGAADINVQFWVLLFPVPTRLNGIFIVLVCPVTLRTWDSVVVDVQVQTSPDTTNGVDGTWTDLLTGSSALVGPIAEAENTPTTSIDGTTGQAASMPAINDMYRRLKSVEDVGIFEMTGPATRQVRGLRFVRTTAIIGSNSVLGNGPQKVVLHLYGESDTTAMDDRLAFWSPIVDLPVTTMHFDWGDTPLASSADKSFRIKNLSDTLTANAILIDAVSAVATGVPAPDTFLLFSTDAGVTWLTSVEIAALSPGAVTGEILVRRVVPANAPLSNWAPRIVADAEGWV